MARGRSTYTLFHLHHARELMSTDRVCVCVCVQYLYGGVSRDVLGPFEDRHEGEAQLVGGLDQAHAVLSHVQQDVFDVHRRRVFPFLHLEGENCKLAQLTMITPPPSSPSSQYLVTHLLVCV